MSIEAEATQTALFSLSNVKDFTQIVFWLTIGLIAILTYNRAKKNLLQPIKTEVFKLQTKRLHELLQAIAWENSVEAWNETGLDECLIKNSHALIEDYAISELHLDLSREDSVRQGASGGLFTKEYAEKNLMLVKVEDENSNDPMIDPVSDKVGWECYEYGHISYFKAYEEFSKSLSNFASDPLIPSHICDLIFNVRDKHTTGLTKIGEALTLAAKELPKAYPKQADLKSANLSWISNLVDGKDEVFKEFQVLRAAIRSYLGTDKLLEF